MSFETTAIVEDRGEVRVPGVPFPPGTEVEVTISPVRHGAGLRWEGNVLVHEGVGVDPSVADLRDQRLKHLGEGRSG